MVQNLNGGSYYKRCKKVNALALRFLNRSFVHASKLETSVYVCLSACLPASQPVRPSCFSIYLSTGICLLVSLSAYLSVCLCDDMRLLRIFFFFLMGNCGIVRWHTGTQKSLSQLGIQFRRYHAAKILTSP